MNYDEIFDEFNSSYVDKEIRKDITIEEAKKSGEDPIFYKLIYSKLTNMDGNKYRAHELIKVIFKLDFSNLMVNIFSDYMKNIFPAYYHVFNNEENVIDWTTTRMQADSLLYTNIYILYYMIVFLILNIIVIIKLLYKKYEFSIKNIYNLLPFLFYTLASSSFLHYLVQ